MNRVFEGKSVVTQETRLGSLGFINILVITSIFQKEKVEKAVMFLRKNTRLKSDERRRIPQKIY